MKTNLTIAQQAVCTRVACKMTPSENRRAWAIIEANTNNNYISEPYIEADVEFLEEEVFKTGIIRCGI